MPAINQNIEIWAGDDNEIDIALKQADGTTPLDLTGVTVNWALSSVYDRAARLITKTSATFGQITITNALNGTLKVFTVPMDTAALGGQPYYHEAEVVVGGTTVTVLTGAATINKTALH